MKCSCGSKAVFSNYCKKHFIEYFESKVKNTIDRFSLIKPGQKIAVACSGGKDSITVLYLMKKFFGSVDALSVDEGIEEYRDTTLEDLKKFCAEHKIPLKITSIKQEFGKPLDSYAKTHRPCSICGVFRRHSLNKMAKGYDVIVTGHNLDDECQSIMMNYMKANLELSSRLGPKTGIIEHKGFVQRVKPLYLMSEKEVRAYTFLMGFDIHYTECPYASISFRYKLGEAINELEVSKPGTKMTVVENFLSVLPNFKQFFSTSEPIMKCSECGEPSSRPICRACTLLAETKTL